MDGQAIRPSAQPTCYLLRKDCHLKAKLNVDVGCGANCQPGFVGMDKRKLDGVEIVHDVEEFPWPLEDGSCSVLVMSHLVEHIKPWLTIDLMNEAWRVLEPKGLLLISTPYAGSYRYFQDPTHCNPWNDATVEYFQQGTPLYGIYTPSPWHVDRMAFHLEGDLEVAFRKADGNGSN